LALAKRSVVFFGRTGLLGLLVFSRGLVVRDRVAAVAKYSRAFVAPLLVQGAEQSLTFGIGADAGSVPLRRHYLPLRIAENKGSIP